ncbi:MAG: hypothetical protein ACR2Q3_10465 [Woeseiaceae bacterium]
MNLRRGLVGCLSLCMFIATPSAQSRPPSQSQNDSPTTPDAGNEAVVRAEGLLWFHCTVDHYEWPSHTEVAVSNTGLVIVLLSNSLRTGFLVPYRQPPAEIQRILETVDRAANTAGLMQPPGKGERKLNACRLTYGPPNARGGSLSVYAQNAERVEPLTSMLRHLVTLADTVANPEAADGPATTASIETDDFEFLPHLFSIMHANEALATGAK